MRCVDADVMPNDSFFKGLSDIEKQKVIQWIVQAPTIDVVPREHLHELVKVAQDNIDSANKRATELTIANRKLEQMYETSRSQTIKEVLNDVRLALVDHYENIKEDLDELEKRWLPSEQE